MSTNNLNALCANFMSLSDQLHLLQKDVGAAELQLRQHLTELAAAAIPRDGDQLRSISLRLENEVLTASDRFGYSDTGCAHGNVAWGLAGATNGKRILDFYVVVGVAPGTAMRESTVSAEQVAAATAVCQQLLTDYPDVIRVLTECC